MLGKCLASPCPRRRAVCEKLRHSVAANDPAESRPEGVVNAHLRAARHAGARHRFAVPRHGLDTRRRLPDGVGSTLLRRAAGPPCARRWILDGSCARHQRAVCANLSKRRATARLPRLHPSPSTIRAPCRKCSTPVRLYSSNRSPLPTRAKACRGGSTSAAQTGVTRKALIVRSSAGSGTRLCT